MDTNNTPAVVPADQTHTGLTREIVYVCDLHAGDKVSTVDEHAPTHRIVSGIGTNLTVADLTTDDEHTLHLVDYMDKIARYTTTA